MSSRLGFSSWLYQLEEYVRLGVDDRLLADERLGGRDPTVGLIVELDDERLSGGVEVAVIDAIGLNLGSGMVNRSRSAAGFPELIRQRVFILTNQSLRVVELEA